MCNLVEYHTKRSWILSRPLGGPKDSCTPPSMESIVPRWSNSSNLLRLALALRSLLGLLRHLVNLGHGDNGTQESVKDSVVEVRVEGQLLNATKLLQGREARDLSQRREPMTARVDGEVAEGVVGSRRHQGKLLDMCRFGEEFGFSCGNRTQETGGAGSSPQKHSLSA
jgi:hypothetical protein